MLDEKEGLIKAGLVEDDDEEEEDGKGSGDVETTEEQNAHCEPFSSHKYTSTMSQNCSIEH